MFLHISNLIHLSLVAGVYLGAEIYLRRTQATRFRTLLRLLQILPIVFLLDILTGVLAIDALYGSQLSAAWIAKTIWLYPLLMLITSWRVYRRKKPHALKEPGQ